MDNNFLNWISQPLPEEDVRIWFNINNINLEKSVLFEDFCLSLLNLINETYLGENEDKHESHISMTNDDNMNHFDWCWEKTISNFEKENIFFIREGDHKEYFKSFLAEVYYDQTNLMVKHSIPNFIKDLFDRDKGFTKSDLELYTEIYKFLDGHIEKQKFHLQ